MATQNPLSVSSWDVLRTVLFFNEGRLQLTPDYSVIHCDLMKGVDIGSLCIKAAL
jgi:hypothetical protein